MGDSIRGQTAIAGLGVTPMGKIYGYDARHFAAEAVRLAVDDAGVARDEIDGLLLNSGIAKRGAIGLGFQNYLGLPNLRLLNHMDAWGATAGSMVHYAALAIHHGMARVVVCVFADAPLRKGGSAGGAYGAVRSAPRGMASVLPAYGYVGANSGYALAARRYMDRYGVGHDQLGAVAVAQRQWAALNPQATMREPFTLEDYHSSRWIVEPFHLLDCCLVSNGAVAVVVTSAERARDLPGPPAYILGMGQGHPGNLRRAGADPLTSSGATLAKRTAFAMAEITTDDVDVCELYDCYTYTVLRTLEDYGFCGQGEAGDFVADGRTRPGGSFPLNTGGGQLSAFYMWGMTPIAEGVQQARGTAGDRQVGKHDVVLVSGNGGTLETHAALLLGPHAN